MLKAGAMDGPDGVGLRTVSLGCAEETDCGGVSLISVILSLLGADADRL